MIVLLITFLCVFAGFISIIFHFRDLHHRKKYNIPDKTSKNLASIFKIIGLIFLSLSIFLVHFNLVVDKNAKTTRTIKLIKISIILIPIAILELIISFI